MLFRENTIKFDELVVDVNNKHTKQRTLCPIHTHYILMSGLNLFKNMENGKLLKETINWSI